MKRRTPIAVALLALVALVCFYPRRPLNAPAPEPVPPETAPPVDADPTPDAREDLRRVHTALHNFLTLVKDPHRPPLGDNRDITRALTGGNPFGEVYLSTNDPAFRDGQWLDRWGTPYWFHPRAPDAIDVRSAGPDRVLFTSDDLVATNGLPIVGN